MSVIFMLNSARMAEILRHLQQNDSSFSPPLSQRVDLQRYAVKLRANAELVESWTEGRELVGLLAYYTDSVTRSSFISSLSVSSAFRGKGLGRALVMKSFEQMRNDRIRIVELEVDAGDPGALAFYRALGFTATGGRDRSRLAKRLVQGDVGGTP